MAPCLLRGPFVLSMSFVAGLTDCDKPPYSPLLLHARSALQSLEGVL